MMYGSVIPAKAGTHASLHSRLAKCPGFPAVHAKHGSAMTQE